MPPTRKFKTGDKVYVPHIDKHYQAKVLKGEFRPDGLWYYHLHYTGWNKKWDEWVEEAGIQSSVGAQVARPLQKKQSISTDVGKSNQSQNKVAKLESSGTETVKNSKKRKTEESSSERQLKLVLDIPPILKKQLLDEFELVTGSGKTVNLPRRPNVTQILRRFHEYGKRELKCANSELQLLVTGLEEYLDKTLEEFLLYEVEWKIAERFLHGGICPAAVYGAEHLLRLLIKLPELIPQTSVSQQQASTLDARLHDLLDFLVTNRHDFFANTTDYAVHNEKSME
eukprot:g8510.t1